MKKAFYEEITSTVKCSMKHTIMITGIIDTLHKLAVRAKEEVHDNALVNDEGGRAHALDILTVFLKHKAPKEGLTKWSEGYMDYCKEKYGETHLVNEWWEKNSLV